MLVMISTRPSEIVLEDSSSGRPQKKSGVLLVNLSAEGFGGLETHVFNLYKELAHRGHRPFILAVANSPFHRRIREAGFACRAVRVYRVPRLRRLFEIVFSRILTGVITRLCREHRLHVIHCNNRFEVPGALRVAKKLPVKVVFNYHVTGPFDTTLLKNIDAVVAPGAAVIRYIDQENLSRRIGIRHTQTIPPLFDADKFLDYRSNEEPARWFASVFGITLKACPVICSIGNMVEDLLHKNYPLLFEAMASLIHERKTPVQAVLVGDGPARPYLESLAETLKIRDYVHFLGYSDQTPGVLAHSDIFVLASSREAFGIVFLEAGLMRKPAIGARDTGAETIIIDKKTGLLFENSSAKSLSNAIERLVGDPGTAAEYGEEAYQRVRHHFSPAAVMPHYEALYASHDRI